MPIQRLDALAFENSTLLRSLGKRLEEYRADRKWSVLQLSKACGVSHAFVTHIMRGVANPSLLVVEKMAQNLGVSEVWLLGFSENAEVKPERKRAARKIVRRKAQA